MNIPYNVTNFQEIQELEHNLYGVVLGKNKVIFDRIFKNMQNFQVIDSSENLSEIYKLVIDFSEL